MVYAEVVGDLGAWVYVDACLGVGLLGDYARDDGDSHGEELVCHAVVDHGLHHGVAEYDFARAFDGGVVVDHGIDIGVEHFLDV